MLSPRLFFLISPENTYPTLISSSSYNINNGHFQKGWNMLDDLLETVAMICAIILDDAGVERVNSPTECKESQFGLFSVLSTLLSKTLFIYCSNNKNVSKKIHSNANIIMSDYNLSLTHSDE